METNKHLLTDIALQLGHHEIRPVYRVAEKQKRFPNRRSGLWDIETISERDNLRQAVMMRLQTPMGELAGLGHPQYGSRLHELIGQVNTDTTRNLARLYILESLKREPRIEKVVLLEVTETRKQPSLVTIELEVKPIDSVDTVIIGPFTLSLD